MLLFGIGGTLLLMGLEEKYEERRKLKKYLGE
jgi:hypothetical protein